MANSHIVVGSGEHRVVVLHGWFGSAGGWGSLPDYLDGSRFTYAFMDCRGYGGSRDVAGSYTVAEVAGDVLDLADELGWGDFSVIGHSMSGKYVQRVLIDAPDRVRRLIGVSPVMAGAFPWDDDSWALFDGAADNRDNRYAIIDFTTGNRLTPTFVNAVTQHSLDNSTRDAFAAYLQAWGKEDFADEVKGDTAPVKLIVGEHDPALGAATMQAMIMPAYPDAELEVLANAGHYSMFETPVALATSIEEFLSR